jgi:hypothetical protein
LGTPKDVGSLDGRLPALLARHHAYRRPAVPLPTVVISLEALPPLDKRLQQVQVGLARLRGGRGTRLLVSAALGGGQPLLVLLQGLRRA